MQTTTQIQNHGKPWGSPSCLVLTMVTAIAAANLPSMVLAQSASYPVKQIRIATYNASLYGNQAGEVRQRLAAGRDRQAEKIARIIQIIRPDILLMNEIDFDPGGETAKLVAEQYLAVGRGEQQGIEYPYVYAAASNTGIDSKLDLNKNLKLNEPNDAWGYGVYPGQYAMAVFSRFPIDEKNLRTFQKFLWRDLPNPLPPIDPATEQPYYDATTWNQLRLSSKNHIDVPIQVGNSTVHVLASHPTPPVFDGPEDRNGCRNHDEIMFWHHYLSESGAMLVDDQGRIGGLADEASFVIMGDLNADPVAGDGRREAIIGLLGHRRVQDPRPQSEGAVEEAEQKSRDGEKAATDTANFGRIGNMRVDYVLPSRTLNVIDSGVFWPRRDATHRDAISASDHRLVWVDVMLPNRD